jgi:hypothetical protein
MMTVAQAKRSLLHQDFFAGKDGSSASIFDNC